MAMSAGYASPRFSPSSTVSAARSPDTASPIYPDRAIRPLPRSRLKSKLSPEQVTNIVYPPDPPPISPTLHFSSVHEQISSSQARLGNGDVHGHHHVHAASHEHCTCGEDGDSGDEEVEFDHPDYRYSAAIPTPVTNGNRPTESVQRRLLEASRAPLKPPPPGSTASSADGYESFENTSNKKKRKIPLSGASSMHQSSLSTEMASMGIGNNEVEQETRGDANSYGPAVSHGGTGISGAGRGRYGRQPHKPERRPLASAMNPINGYNARVPRIDTGVKHLENGNENSGGIISQAIKSAAEQRPRTPQSGKDNVSLLQSANSSTPKSQFTFACESESASKMADQQAAAAAAAAYASSMRAANAQLPHAAPQPRQGPPPPNMNSRPPPLPNMPNTVAHAQKPPAPPAPRPKPRPRLSREYVLAARQRQLQQEYTNYNHRPTKDNMYICEFCEYEDIFGVPPAAMIRRYEIKDREERKKAAERRRLLEKAKMKNRKGKRGKGGKMNGNGAAGNSPTPGSNTYDPDLPPGPDGEEYYDDEEYGDEYDPVDGEPYDEGPLDHSYHPPPLMRGGLHPASAPAGGGGIPPRPPPIPSS